MNFYFKLQAVLLLFSYLHLASAISPPGELMLIYPISAVPLYQNFSLGFGDSNKTGHNIYGLPHNTSVSLKYPNGTLANVMSTFGGDDTFCLYPSVVAAVGYFLADQVGQHIVFWNVSYGISSDPSKANISYCGPPPFSFQSWTLNRTFEVQGSGNSGPAEATVTASFSTQPTGNLPTSGSMKSGVHVGVVGLAALILGAMLHC